MAYPADQPILPAPAPQTTGGALSIVSFVFGVLALLLALAPFTAPFLHLIGLGLAVVAVVLGHLGYARREAQRGFGVAGLTLGYIAAGISLLRFVGGLLIALRHAMRRGGL